MNVEVVETHTILPDIISPGFIVVDCGANVGRFIKDDQKVWLLMHAIGAAPDTFSNLGAPGGQQAAGCNQRRSIETPTE
jgi:hypothetical protein